MPGTVPGASNLVKIRQARRKGKTEGTYFDFGGKSLQICELKGKGENE